MADECPYCIFKRTDSLEIHEIRTCKVCASKNNYVVQVGNKSMCTECFLAKHRICSLKMCPQFKKLDFIRELVPTGDDDWALEYWSRQLSCLHGQTLEDARLFEFGPDPVVPEK